MWEKDLSMEPRLIDTSQSSRGAALSRDRVLKFLRNTLLQRSDTYVTTMFDLYGLRSDFPGQVQSGGLQDPYKRAGIVEKALAEAALGEAQCPEYRFIPHIQPFEFEALLFASPAAIATADAGWEPFSKALFEIRAHAATPEHINDGYDTHPSARLVGLLRPKYQKVRHGSQAALRVGIPRMRAECRHFDDWLTQLEALKPLGAGA